MAGKKHPNYPTEFRARAVDLVLTTGLSTPAVAKMLKVNERTLSSWVAAEKKKLREATAKQATHEVEAKTPDTDNQPATATPSDTKTEQQKERQMTVNQQSSIWELTNNKEQNNRQMADEPIGSVAIHDTPETYHCQGESDNVTPNQAFEALRQENRILKQQRNTLRDAIILLATHTSAEIV